MEATDKYGEVAGYKISVQNPTAFLYTNKEASETKKNKTIPFAIATKGIKYLGINLTKGGKDLDTENYNILLKGIEKIQQNEKMCHVYRLAGST